jgi:preprotein translocase subunit SecB
MQNIQISPLQLEKYFLAELRFKINSEIESSEIKLDSFNTPQIDIESDTKELDKENRKWRSEVKVSTKSGNNIPYEFSISLIGFFKIHEKYPPEMIEQLAKFNCPSILYSTAREMLTTTIRRSPIPPVMLPSVMFSPVLKEEDAKPKRKNSSQKKDKKS